MPGVDAQTELSSATYGQFDPLQLLTLLWFFAHFTVSAGVNFDIIGTDLVTRLDLLQIRLNKQTDNYPGLLQQSDLLLQGDDRPDCYVEIKNVTAANETGMAFFPDAVSARGTKHLRELMAMVDGGYRAVLVFSVQRADVNAVRPADEIDPLYGKTLREALTHGVEALAYGCRISPEEISLERSLPVLCEELCL